MLRQWLRPWLKRSTTHHTTLESLGAPVELRTDQRGVCHILAKNEEDLFRAQGYITARDRLFQMDMLRRTAGGRLAEFYGDVPGVGLDNSIDVRGRGLASIDYLMRVFGLQQAAQQGLSWLSPQTHRALLSYAEGVNEYIEQTQDELPLAYKILNASPEEWHPTDSLLILRYVAFQLSFPWKLLLNFGAICAQLKDHPRKLNSMLPPHLDLTLGDTSPESMHQLFPDAPQDEHETIPATKQLYEGTGQGSCAWVVSGKWTQHKKPLLCNDPHLLLRLPCTFYQIRLHGGQYDVIGQSIPGTPAIYVGHNDQIAWGASLGRVDDADIFVEELDRTGERYRHKDRYIPFIRREELIKVRGETTKHRWVRSTSRGPLLSDALRGPLPQHMTYSLSWVGHEGVREAEAMMRLARANHWDDFLDAMKYARVPALGYVYADKQGHIGGILAGRCPKRTHSPRIFRPLPAAQGEYDWCGDIPFDELPKTLDPEEGFLILTGQQPSRSLPEHTIQGFWAPPHRYKRIKEMLKRQLNKGADGKSMGRLQRDQYSLWGKEFIDRELNHYAQRAQLAGPVKKSLQNLLEWNGRVGPESLAATFFTMFQLQLMELTYRPALGEHLYRQWIDIATELEAPVEPLFREEKLWSDLSKGVLLHHALTQAHKELQKRLGADPQTWQWNRLHRLTLHSLFFWAGGLQDNFTRGPYGTGGNGFSINTGSHSWSRPFEHRVGSAARHIIELADWDQSRWILCGGQKEDPESVHYDDQLEMWLSGGEFPMSFSFAALRNMQESWLTPRHHRQEVRSNLKETH